MMIKLRPSDSDRWMICRRSPGYVAENLHRIPEEDKPYADEGAQAHDVAEQVLKQFVLRGLLPALPRGVKIPRDMTRHVLNYARFVQGLVTEHCYLYVEESVQVFYAPDRTGKVDAALVYFDPASHWRTITKIHIIDLKYGAGKSVQAEDNNQLLIYFKSMMDRLLDGGKHSLSPDAECIITIWQPRIAGEPCERTWTLDPQAVQYRSSAIRIVAESILADPVKHDFVPGDEQCGFCPAKDFCEARTRWLLGSGDDVVDLSPTVYSATPVNAEGLLPDPLSLSLNQLTRVLEMAPRVRKWMSGVEDYCQRLAVHQNKRIPGFKVVASSPKRRWKDPKQALRYLLDNAPEVSASDLLTDPALVSPSTVEELLADCAPEVLTGLRAHIVRPEGSPTLVPESDKRGEWRDASVEDEFENGLL